VANNSGSPVRISDIKVSGKNIGPIYFGFAHEIPGSLIKINELRPNAQIHCPIDNVHSLTSHFGKVESADEIELHKFAGAMLIICHPPYVDFTVRVYLGTAPST
jgi:hypothetical protein